MTAQPTPRAAWVQEGDRCVSIYDPAHRGVVDKIRHDHRPPQAYVRWDRAPGIKAPTVITNLRKEET